MAGAQGLRTRGSQSIQKDSHSRARAPSRPQRAPLLPRVQMHVRCFAARLYAAPAHRGGPGINADNIRALERDCAQVRHVRSTALHAIFPAHSRRDALRLAPHSASHAGHRLRLRLDCTNAIRLASASLNQQSKDAPTGAVRGAVYGRRAQLPQTNAINRWDVG